MPAFTMDRVVWGDRGWQHVEYGFAPTKEAFAHAVKGRGESVKDNPYPVTYGCCVQFENDGHRTTPACIVTINDEIDRYFVREPWLVLAVIAHEAMHVWQFIEKTLGETKAGEEIEAHAIQYITSNLFEAYIKTRGRRAKRKRKA